MLTYCMDDDERIKGWLQRLCCEVTAEEDGVYHIKCEMTQQEISDYLFIHVTTFNRIFTKLKQKKICLKTRKGFEITDAERLKEALSIT